MPGVTGAGDEKVETQYLSSKADRVGDGGIAQWHAQRLRQADYLVLSTYLNMWDFHLGSHQDPHRLQAC